jgi:hypothetical protein
MHSMLINPIMSYSEDCLHDSIFKGSAPPPQPSTASPSRIAVPDTIEEEATGRHFMVTLFCARIAGSLSCQLVGRRVYLSMCCTSTAGDVCVCVSSALGRWFARCKVLLQRRLQRTYPTTHDLHLVSLRPVTGRPTLLARPSWTCMR